MTSNETAYQSYLDQRKSADLLRELVDVQPAGAKLLLNGREYVNLSSNDYLGLSQHETLIVRACQWAERFGAGVAASRLVTGNIEAFSNVEIKIAKLKGAEAALLMASGFQTNASVLEAIFDKRVLGAEPLVFSDRLNHASMHFGCAAAQIRQIRYRHCDVAHLSELLIKYQQDDRPKFILTESVFSMDGDVAPIKEIAALATAHNAQLICDDAHATGILGPGGAGLSEDSHITIGTCSKALGSFGAFVTCSNVMRAYLVNRCSGLIYSTGLPPAVLGAMDAALDLLPELDEERARTAQMAVQIRETARRLGIDTGNSQTQIVPLIIGEPEHAISLSDYLKEHGFWVGSIRPPTVPKGTSRLRVAVSAAHTAEDIDRFCGCLELWSAQQRTKPA